MFNYFQKIGSFYQRQRLGLRFLAPLLVAAWFIYSFSGISSYEKVIFGAGNWQQFSLEFPFFLLAALFLGHIGLVASIVVYILSAIVYVAIAYEISSWLEQYYLRHKDRPLLILKEIRGPRLVR